MGEITPSSGNVFADLGLPNPEARLRAADALARGVTVGELARLYAVEAAARAFRLSELRLLNYRDPHYPQHEADHLAARRALRDALGDSDS